MHHKSKKHKDPGDLSCYALFKIANGMLYLVTLSLALGYFMTSKFNSKFVYYIFEGILFIRPLLIAFYSLIMWCLEYKRRGTKLTKREFGMATPEGLPAITANKLANVKYLDDNSR